jgi:hypothetical protein
MTGGALAIIIIVTPRRCEMPSSLSRRMQLLIMVTMPLRSVLKILQLFSFLPKVLFCKEEVLGDECGAPN